MSLVKSINPGRLSKRVTIMKHRLVENEIGNMVEELYPYKTVWAEVLATRGKEQVEYQKTEDQMLYKVTMRYEEVTAKDVLLYKDIQLEVQAPPVDLREDRRYIEITCSRKIDFAQKEVDDAGNNYGDGGYGGTEERYGSSGQQISGSGE